MNFIYTYFCKFSYPIVPRHTYSMSTSRLLYIFWMNAIYLLWADLYKILWFLAISNASTSFKRVAGLWKALHKKNRWDQGWRMFVELWGGFGVHIVLIFQTCNNDLISTHLDIHYHLNMKHHNHQWTVENPFFNYSIPVTFGVNRRNSFLPQLFVELYDEQLGALGKRKFRRGKNFTIAIIYMIFTFYESRRWGFQSPIFFNFAIPSKRYFVLKVSHLQRCNLIQKSNNHCMFCPVRKFFVTNNIFAKNISEKIFSPE